MTPQLFDDLRRDEGLSLKAYRDPVDRWTIGYGHAEGVTEGERWTEYEAEETLHADVQNAIKRLDLALPWWRTINDVRQDALVEMAFNLGIGGLMGFHHALDYMVKGEWQQASAQLLLSKWAAQVGERAHRLAHMIRTGSRSAVVS